MWRQLRPCGRKSSGVNSKILTYLGKTCTACLGNTVRVGNGRSFLRNTAQTYTAENYIRVLGKKNALRVWEIPCVLGMGDLFYEALHKHTPPEFIYPGSYKIPEEIYRLKTISGYLYYNQLYLLDAWRTSIGIFCAPRAFSNKEYLHLCTANLHTKIDKYIIILLFSQPDALTPADKVQTLGEGLTEIKKTSPCYSTARSYFLTWQKSHLRNYSTPKVLIWPVGPGESGNIWLKWLTYLWQVW